MEPVLTGDAETDAQVFPMTARLFAYWSGLPSAPRQIWADVDLMELYDIAPWIFVADVMHSGASLNFVYRFVGTRIVDTLGIDATGKAVDVAFEGERAQLIIDVYTGIVESKSPQLGIRHQANKDRGHVRMAVLTVPLFTADGEVEKLIGINDFSVMNSEERRNFQGRI